MIYKFLTSEASANNNNKKKKFSILRSENLKIDFSFAHNFFRFSCVQLIKPDIKRSEKEVSNDRDITINYK